MAGDRRNPGAAFLLSVVPGVGHLYAGRTGAGIGWLVAVLVAYRFLGEHGLVAVAVFLHFLCAVNAAQAVQAVNRAETEELASRRESASDVARLLDEAVARGGDPAPAAPGPETPVHDPPPRVLRAAFPVPPERLLEALAAGMGAGGMRVLGTDRARQRIRATADLGGVRGTAIVAQVEAAPAGSRVRILIDRPPGSAPGPEPDDAALRAILERTERLLAGAAPGAAAVRGPAESLTEDHFLEQLREAWESFEQGWLPEEEWRERKDSLVRSVTLRAGTRKTDFMSACRPLVEAGVLDAADLRTLESTIPN
jgi:hypothetical protein